MHRTFFGRSEQPKGIVIQSVLFPHKLILQKTKSAVFIKANDK